MEMEIETLHDALASIGFRSQPKPDGWGREIFDKEGKSLGVMDAKAGWELIHLIRKDGPRS